MEERPNFLWLSLMPELSYIQGGCAQALDMKVSVECDEVHRTIKLNWVDFAVIQTSVENVSISMKTWGWNVCGALLDVCSERTPQFQIHHHIQHILKTFNTALSSCSSWDLLQSATSRSKEAKRAQLDEKSFSQHCQWASAALLSPPPWSCTNDKNVVFT